LLTKKWNNNEDLRPILGVVTAELGREHDRRACSSCRLRVVCH
jgi:hypothetical protein